MSYKTINPFNNETVEEFPSATDAEIDRALDTSHRAFVQWSKTSIANRTEVLRKAASILAGKKNEFARIATLEMGKILSEAEGEVDVCIEIFNYYADKAETFLAPRVIDAPGLKSGKLLREPLGIILAVEPWNFPFYQVTRVLAPQLAAGNVVILKHASNVPQCALAFERLMKEAGLLEGGFINVFAGHEQISRIIQDPRVHGVALTGSEKAGELIAAEAGRALKKSTMELGGSDALIVLADADIEMTARNAVLARMRNTGQICTSSKRLIILDSVYDEFIDRLTKGVADRKPGNPFDASTTLAPLSSQVAADHLQDQVRQAVAAGATKTVIGPEVPDQGAFFQPLMLTGITADNPAFRWEFFGPVALVFKVKTEEEAIALANDSPFGLGGSVYSRDDAHAESVARQINTGMVFINMPNITRAAIPFGGIRRSGYGRELYELGISEFVNHKFIGIA